MKPTSFALLALILLGGGLADAADGKYVKPELLVEPGDLAKLKDQKDLVILDVRSRKKYDESRLPNARWIEHAAWIKAFGNGKDVAGWNQRIGDVGITPASRVIVYDDSVKDAGQIWWVLRYWGVDDVRLLHGGYPAWKAAGHPLETGSPASFKAAAIQLKPRGERLATIVDVKAIVDGKAPQQLLDTRSPDEFTGAEKHARRGGTIPTSKNLDWTELFDAKTQRFKSADELAKLFRDAGIDIGKPTTAFCQTGRRSSVSVFALELLGSTNNRNYFASWFEWGNLDDTTVVPGKAK